MSKVVGIFVKGWHFLTMPAHQIWSYDVTQEANFENFLFCPDSTFNIGKSKKFPVEKLSTSEVINQKPHGGGMENTPPPSAFRVKLRIDRRLCRKRKPNKLPRILRSRQLRP